VQNADNTVTLPLFRGTSRGRTVWYVLLNSSDGPGASSSIARSSASKAEINRDRRRLGPAKGG
jgi:hypothetical protein